VIPRNLNTLVNELVPETLKGSTHATREIDLHVPGETRGRPVRVTLTTLRETEGEIDAVVVVLEDLSLTREVAELRRLDELKSNFLAMVSHELRTPLTSIKGVVHLLGSGALEESAEQRMPMYQILAKNTERLIAQINDILDVNQIEHNTLRIFPREFDLGECIERSATRHRAAYEEKGVALEADLPPNTALEADEERIGQVIHHLIDNALKFTPRGGRVRLWVESDEERVSIHVHDTGVGVDPAQRDKVFAKFFQLEHTLTRQAGGSGLGLFLAKELVELHGGKIAFGPTEGPGAHLVIDLPRSQPFMAIDAESP
jgi:signal transduction histidine kinase